MFTHLVSLNGFYLHPGKGGTISHWSTHVEFCSFMFYTCVSGLFWLQFMDVQFLGVEDRTTHFDKQKTLKLGWAVGLGFVKVWDYVSNTPNGVTEKNRKKNLSVFAPCYEPCLWHAWRGTSFFSSSFIAPRMLLFVCQKTSKTKWFNDSTTSLKVNRRCQCYIKTLMLPQLKKNNSVPNF